MDVKNRFSTLGMLHDPEECWQSVRMVIQEAADRIVGLQRHKHQSWLSDEAHDVSHGEVSCKEA